MLWTTIGNREDYGTKVHYEYNDLVSPLNFTEGLSIDYRQFDEASITPRSEFDYDLSYTKSFYLNLPIDGQVSATKNGVSRTNHN